MNLTNTYSYVTIPSYFLVMLIKTNDIHITFYPNICALGEMKVHDLYRRSNNLYITEGTSHMSTICSFQQIFTTFTKCFQFHSCRLKVIAAKEPRKTSILWCHCLYQRRCVLTHNEWTNQ